MKTMRIKNVHYYFLFVAFNKRMTIRGNEYELLLVDTAGQVWWSEMNGLQTTKSISNRKLCFRMSTRPSLQNTA